MAIRLVRTHSQARVQEQDAAVGPRCQVAVFVGRGREGRVVARERYVDVFQTCGRGRGGAHGEGEAVGLERVVVGVLAEDYGFDGVEGCMTGPIHDVSFDPSLSYEGFDVGGRDGGRRKETNQA